ncbi:hypothetical protein D9757_000240 [Collybiopsis confluens]|uniref:Uncharacterized protein n=1 Tax=Collybiopsis confluens TaxID=2823264 RepID=A0A8H5I260_9AGAR|nr:hypothetical protein D9757_000240 [Collybiopsis confluens]
MGLDLVGWMKGVTCHTTELCHTASALHVAERVGPTELKEMPYNEIQSHDRQASQPSSPPRLNYNYSNPNARGPSIPALRSNPLSGQHLPPPNSRPSSSQSAASIISASPPASTTNLHVLIPSSTSPTASGSFAHTARSPADTPTGPSRSIHPLDTMPIPTRRPHSRTQSDTIRLSNQPTTKIQYNYSQELNGNTGNPSSSTPGHAGTGLSGPAAAFVRPAHSTANHSGSGSGSSYFQAGPPSSSAPATFSTNKTGLFHSSSFSALPTAISTLGHPSSIQQRRASGPAISGSHSSPFASPLSAARPTSVSTSPVFLHQVSGSNTSITRSSPTSATAGPSTQQLSSTTLTGVSSVFSGMGPSSSSALGTHLNSAARPHVSPSQKHNVPHDLHIIHPSSNTHNSIMPSIPPPTPFTPSTLMHPQLPPTPTTSAGHPAQQATSALLASTQKALEHTWSAIISSVDGEITKLHSSHAGQIKVWAEYAEGLKRESEKEAQGYKVQLKSLESQLREMRQEEGSRKVEVGRTEKIHLELIDQLKENLDGLQGKYDALKGERNALQSLARKEGSGGDSTSSPSTANAKTSAERDRMAADLERIRAERNELRRQVASGSTSNQYELDSLRATNASLLSQQDKMMNDIRDFPQLAVSYNSLVVSNNDLQATHSQLKREFEDLLEREEKARNKKIIAEEALKKERERAFEIDEARKREKKDRKEKEKEVMELKKKLDSLMGVRVESSERDVIDIEARESASVARDVSILEDQVSSASRRPFPSEGVTDVDAIEVIEPPVSELPPRTSPQNITTDTGRLLIPDPSRTSSEVQRCPANSSVPTRNLSGPTSQSPPLQPGTHSPRVRSSLSPLPDHNPLSGPETHHYQKFHPGLNRASMSPTLEFGPMGRRTDSMSTALPILTSSKTPHPYDPRPMSPFPTLQPILTNLHPSRPSSSSSLPALHPISTNFHFSRPSSSSSLPTLQQISTNFPSSRPSSSSASVSHTGIPPLSPSLPQTLPRRHSSTTSVMMGSSNAKGSPRLTLNALSRDVDMASSSAVSSNTFLHSNRAAHPYSEVAEGEAALERSPKRIEAVEEGEELEVDASSQQKEKRRNSLIKFSSPSPFTSIPYLDSQEDYRNHPQPQQRLWNPAHRDSPSVDKGKDGAGRDRGQLQWNLDQRPRDRSPVTLNHGASMSADLNEVKSLSIQKRKAVDDGDVQPYSPQPSYTRGQESQPHKLSKIMRHDGQIVGIAPHPFEAGDHERRSWHSASSDDSLGRHEQLTYRSGGLINPHHQDHSSAQSHHGIEGNNGTELHHSSVVQSSAPSSVSATSPISPRQHPASKSSVIDQNSTSFPPNRRNSASSKPHHPSPFTNSKPVFATLNHQPSLPVNPIHSNSPTQVQLQEFSPRSADGWKRSSTGRAWGEADINGSHSNMNVMNTSSAGSGQGWKTASVQDYPPSTVRFSGSSAAPPPPKQLSFKHLELLYDTVAGEYICRECRASSTSTMTKPKSFPTSALSFVELFAHVSEEHKEREEEVLKYGSVKLQEQLVLLKRGGPHVGVAQGGGGKKVGGKKSSK